MDPQAVANVRTHGEVEGGEVVVKEELALHEEEGEVVQEPAEQEEPAEAIVEDDLGCDWARESAYAATLLRNGTHCGQSPGIHAEREG